jgi:glucan biosynthesis protein
MRHSELLACGTQAWARTFPEVGEKALHAGRVSKNSNQREVFSGELQKRHRKEGRKFTIASEGPKVDSVQMLPEPTLRVVRTAIVACSILWVLFAKGYRGCLPVPLCSAAPNS